MSEQSIRHCKNNGEGRQTLVNKIKFCKKASFTWVDSLNLWKYFTTEGTKWPCKNKYSILSMFLLIADNRPSDLCSLRAICILTTGCPQILHTGHLQTAGREQLKLDDAKQ